MTKLRENIEELSTPTAEHREGDRYQACGVAEMTGCDDARPVEKRVASYRARQGTMSEEGGMWPMKSCYAASSIKRRGNEEIVWYCFIDIMKRASA